MEAAMSFSLGRILISISLPILLGACATPYFAKEIRGKVVDADSGEPLGGVNVVAKWDYHSPVTGHGSTFLYLTETVTGDDGSYVIPSLGPTLLPPLANFWGGHDPRMLIFKREYAPAFLSNDLVSPENIHKRKPPVGDTKWNGQTIKLKKWQGSLERYWDELSSLCNELPHNTKQEWRQYPHILLAIKKEELRLVPITPNLRTRYLGCVHVDWLSPEDQAYLKGFEK